MPLIISVLSIVVLLNFILAIIILSRGVRDKINVFFGLISFTTAIWSIAILGFYLIELSGIYSSIWIIITHSAAALIALFFLFFTLNFPISISKNRLVHFLILVPPFIIFYLLFFTKQIIGNVFNYKYDINSGYLFYIIYIIFYFSSAFFALFLQFKKANDSVHKAQIKYVFVGALLSSVSASVTDLIFPFINIFNYTWLGPVFTIFLVIAIAYAILRHHLFDIRVVATEIFIFIIWTTLSVKTVLSTSLQDLIINCVILLFLVIAGILLIRSVLKEVKQRELMEKMAEDIQKAYEVEKKAKEELQRLDEAKTQFTMATQHHLRTPLTSMRGYIDLIKGGTYGDIPPKLVEPIDKFEVSTKRLIKIVNEFLDISQFQLGKQVVSLKPNVKVEPIIKEIIEELKYEVDTKKLYLILEQPDKVHEIKADEEKLKVALFNLVDNAIKYTQKGGVRITITDGDEVEIKIKDTGLGIAKEDISKLFGRTFERGKEAKKVFTTGRGIGLYITSEIIKAHNGKIWAESDGVGMGSTFHVELPAQ